MKAAVIGVADGCGRSGTEDKHMSGCGKADTHVSLVELGRFEASSLRAHLRSTSTARERGSSCSRAERPPRIPDASRQYR